MKRCSTLFSGLVLAVCAREAHADGGCTGLWPWVAVSGDVPAAFAEAVRSDLRAGLAPSRIDVCAGHPRNASDPLARVTLEQAGLGGARYSLEVIDATTRRRVSRELALERLPPDGRAFAVAVAAEELLRASWAELALRGAHSAETAAPPEARAEAAEVAPRPRAPRRFVALGARLAFEHFLGGQTHYGADLFGALPVGRFATGVLALGARRARSADAPHGRIDASALSAELGLSISLWRQGGLELGAFVSERLLRLSFDPDAAPGAASSTRHGLVAVSRLGLGFAFGSAGRLRSYTALGAGLPLKSFSAADGARTVTGASELELFASTGLGWELP